MKKLNKKKTLFSLLMVAGISTTMMAASILGKADQKINEDNPTLSIEKLDKETLKIALSDIVEIPKALQFSIEIDGNMTFDTESINWLIQSTNHEAIQHDIKVSDDQKKIEFFLLSNEALKKIGSVIDIAEIDVVSPKNQATKYSVTAAVQQDGMAYKYVIADTNKQVTGAGMNLVDGGELTYNTPPVLSLVPSAQVVEGKIMLTIGDEFTKEIQTSFVQAIDEEDGIITKIDVEGTVDTSIIGSYSLTYRVEDSIGEEATLTVPVIVENKVEEEVENPVISGAAQVVYLNVGDTFNVLEGIEAIDYSGRQLDIMLSGDYESTIVDGKVTKAGTYTIQYDAVDRHGNVAPSVITTLIVTEPDHPQISGVVAEIELTVGDTFDALEGISAVDYDGNTLEVIVSGTYTEALENNVLISAGTYDIQYEATDKYGNKTTLITILTVKEKPEEPEIPSIPDYIIPDELKDVIDMAVMNPISGNASKETPLEVEVLEQATIASIKQLMKNYEVSVERHTARQSVKFNLILTNGSQQHHLLLVVAANNTEVINYLDSLITEGPTEPDTEGPTEPDTEGPTEPDTEGPTEPDTEGPTGPDTEGPTGPEPDQTTPNNGGTNKPSTGIQVALPVVIVGVVAILSGGFLLLKRRKK